MESLNIGIVGAGIIGCSWAMVWARKGHTIRVFDADEDSRAGVTETLQRYTADLKSVGIEIPDSCFDRVQVVDSIADAISNADYVQESVSENIDIKRAVFSELEKYAQAGAILGSSTSALAMSHISGNLATRHRCLVVHPATPPHLIPVVEIVPSTWTDRAITEYVFKLMEGLGQTPVLVKKEVPSFVMNRLQGALLNEMFRLIENEVISAGHIDKLISDGFGLRWAFLGPLEGVDLNAPGGIADYLDRFGKQFDGMAMEPREPRPILNPKLIAILQKEMREKLPLDRLNERRSWRDRRMAALTKLRDDMNAATTVPLLNDRP